MNIVVLMEDTPGAAKTAAEHGFSLYIETENHRILADTGASDLTWENAKQLGIDVKQVDTVVLSHGHYDHGGGLPGFAKQNDTAKIYMQNSAFGKYYHGERYIGIDGEIQRFPNVCTVGGFHRIDEELSVFAGITGRRNWPKSNLVLSERRDGHQVQDEFKHEQCLVIQDGEKTLLISGCAHNGILNILDRFSELYHCEPDLVISGFHMMKKTAYTKEEMEIIQETARELTKKQTRFYTGHCTGSAAIELMSGIMKDQLQVIHSGDRIL